MAETITSLAHGPRLSGRIADFLDRLAELLRQARVLLILQVLALWPVWLWYAARLTDGSDEPLGGIALVLAGCLVWARRGEFRPAPRLIPVLLAAALTLAQAAADALPLVRALLGMVALALVLAALLPRPRETAPLAALLVLSLPLVASLQFYAGYPLRLLAAEGASLLLHGAGWPVRAEGAGLRWEGRFMLVDAPCSGVHMLWVGLAAAAAASAVVRAAPSRLALNLGLAAILVLLGNVLRNAALFFKETGVIPLPDWTHSGIGLALFVLTLAPVLLVSLKPAASAGGVVAGAVPSAPGRTPTAAMGRGMAGRRGNRFSAAAWLLAGTLLILAGLAGARPPAAEPSAEPQADLILPASLRGRDLVPLPLAPDEVRRLRGFPGAAARYAEGAGEWLIRRVDRPTRLLHSAADCFRGLGYAVSTPVIREGAEGRWNCFVARKEGLDRNVCERIRDEAGGTWTDVSAWYWATVLGRSRGPWWSEVHAEAAVPAAGD